MDNESDFYKSDQFPDAAQKTAAFFHIVSIRALRRVLDFAKAHAPADLRIDIDDIWDTAKQFFPGEFGKQPNADRISKIALVTLLKEYKLPELLALQPEAPLVISAPESGPQGGLQCRYCDKPVNSTSGKTLHEKVCKRRPPSINPITGEIINAI